MSTATSHPHPQPHSRHTPFTNDPVIRVDGLTRIYATGSRKKKAASTDSTKSAKSTEYTAVDGISFEVHRGEVYGLLGTNGAGKTSSLEVIEGLAAPSSGSVTIFGRDPRKERDIVRPSLGIMLQSGGLPRELTVAETMRMWSGTCSTPRPIAEVLAEVGLEHRTDVRVGSLSGGEQRRLDLACALLNDPSVVFLDEPTTGLDPESRARTWDLLDGLKLRGVTMVLTTHYLEEAEHLADRIAIMDAGSIAVEGRLSELVAAEPSEITFSLPGGPEISDALPYEPDLSGFPDFSGSVVTREGHRFSIATPHLQHDTLRLLTWASSQRLDLEQFTARPANLEKVFHSVVGRRSQSI